MKTTDEMILDLVAAGFVLPEGTELLGGDLAIKGEAFTEVDTRQNFAAILLRKQLVYDLFACKCARELTHGKRNNARALGLLGDPLDLFREWLGKGNTEAAIKALWEGVCA